MKVEPFLLVSTINIIIAQRLIRKLGPSKESYILNKEELANLGKIISLDRMLTLLKAENIVDKGATWDKIPFYKAKIDGSTEDGFSGRIGIHEVLRVNSAIKEMIMKGATAGVIEEEAKRDGMMTMIEDGIFQAVQGTTTIEEVLRVISE
jgi:type II secretory ATPase GspE/PulE/Tfp pilus assembly ATPase PilB-like protein